MFYYLIALLKSNAPLLTYASQNPLEKYEIVALKLKNKNTFGVVIESTAKPSFQCKEVEKTNFYFTSIQIKLANFIAQYYCTSYGETFGIFTPQEKNTDNAISPKIAYHLKTLNQQQQKALLFCENKNLSLLFGDTGSGKTEIFFHLITKILNQNKQALFLMPEISLTPQTEKRLKDAFGDIVGIWHSKITNKKKQEILKRLQNGEIKIIAGARSALFLPLQNLGIIIVDEEHDDAYKSQNKPRYNAKDLCIFLAKQTDIKVVLGSATPSIQSYYLASKEKSIFRLKGTFFDSKKNIEFDISTEVLNQKLLNLIAETLKRDEQIIIFAPTRANFKTLLCNKCGNTIMCKYCSVAMSLHHKKNMMLCHYCNFSMPIPEKCPTCNATDFISKRIGTAQLAIDLQNNFPDIEIAIFDKDHANTEKKLKQLLSDFSKKKTQILIGTQMIAKGHDFHNVKLAIILEIDYLLKSPDFRCTEKTFSLIYQVAGRSGRKENGKVVIQSLNAVFLREYLLDYQDFLDYELQNRKEFYPPFTKLVILHFENKEENLAKSNMQNILSLIKNQTDIFEVVGYGKSGIEKIGNIYRYHILLRSYKITQTIKILQKLLHSQRNFEIDIDPIDFS
ncbi:primosomal protein N' [Helicobacter anseris]|uniref:Replication restart protein PriA n=1 Tax=Helicobacter anseris TaxID=375926 RepID=A0A3D8J7E6_9HELI|nr:primosomal protein N' [Helicobacter anseris]RDU72814.1 primosomal protein N' [Helicobacter anseris]